MANNCGNLNNIGGKRSHTYSMNHTLKSAMAETSNSSAGSADTNVVASTTTSASHHTSSNHCEDWNPNQIVYNKVCLWI